MAIVTDTVLTVRIGSAPVAAFSYNALGEEAAKAAARANRDRGNASEYGQANGQPYRITRSVTRKRVNHL